MQTVIDEDYDNNLLNLAIANFCPNLRKLLTMTNQKLKIIFNNCQYLESIKVWSDYGYYGYSDLKELFEIFAKMFTKKIS